MKYKAEIWTFYYDTAPVYFEGEISFNGFNGFDLILCYEDRTFKGRKVGESDPYYIESGSVKIKLYDNRIGYSGRMVGEWEDSDSCDKGVLLIAWGPDK